MSHSALGLVDSSLDQKKFSKRHTINYLPEDHLGKTCVLRSIQILRGIGKPNLKLATDCREKATIVRERHRWQDRRCAPAFGGAPDPRGSWRTLYRVENGGLFPFFLFPPLFWAAAVNPTEGGEKSSASGRKRLNAAEPHWRVRYKLPHTMQ